MARWLKFKILWNAQRKQFFDKTDYSTYVKWRWKTFKYKLTRKKITRKCWQQTFMLYVKEINKATNFYTNVRMPILNSSLILYGHYNSDTFLLIYTEHCFTYPLDTPFRSVIIFTSFTEPYLAKKLLISVSSICEK